MGLSADILFSATVSLAIALLEAFLRDRAYGMAKPPRAADLDDWELLSPSRPAGFTIALAAFAFALTTRLTLRSQIHDFFADTGKALAVVDWVDFILAVAFLNVVICWYCLAEASRAEWPSRLRALRSQKTRRLLILEDSNERSRWWRRAVFAQSVVAAFVPILLLLRVS